MTTYANQKIVHINKGNYKSDFLMISNDEWAKASQELNYNTFKLYLYLASNVNGFDLALSQKAVNDMLGMSKATYHRAVIELEEKGYLTLKQGNIYNFYTTPKDSLTNETVSSMSIASLTDETKESHARDKVVSPVSTEIDKINKINNLYKGDRELEDLSFNEIGEIKVHLKNHVKYIDIAKMYNLKLGSITKDFEKNINTIKEEAYKKEQCTNIIEEFKKFKNVDYSDYERNEDDVYHNTDNLDLLDVLF